MGVLRSLALLAVVVQLAGCASSRGTHGAEAADQHPYWSYTEGDSGPSQWTVAGYPACGEFTQSPIVIRGATFDASTRITFEYGTLPLRLFNDGHTVKALARESGETNAIVVEQEVKGQVTKERYALAQFHVHAPGEHRFGDAGPYALELHLVHARKDEHGNESAVAVGVMIRAGQTSSEPDAYRTLFAQMPNNGNLVRNTGRTIDLRQILPSLTPRFYHYVGSLTTPPCTLGVQWFVLPEPVALRPGTTVGYQNLFKVQTPPGNSRPAFENTVVAVTKNFP